METSVIKKLILEAQDIIKKRYKPHIHEVGCALLTKSGKLYKAVHLEAHVGRIAVCAEAVAIGMAAAEGDTDLELIVAVNRAGEVVSPCGMCRELISDYSKDCLVIMSKSLAVNVMELLPRKCNSSR